MATYQISFTSPVRDDDDQGRGPEPKYSAVWSFLHNYYGNPAFADGKGSCFRGKKGETAVLTDNSLENGIHELVLVNVPLSTIRDLEQALDKNDMEHGFLQER